jgi:Flp pilus assembly protein TadG
VELAVVAPVLLAMLFGIIDFGTTFNNYQALRQGVRDTARQGAVANFGPTASAGCLNFTGAGAVDPGAGDVKNLMCQVHTSITGGGLGIDTTSLRVMVGFSNAGLTGSGTYAVGNGLIVCAQYSLTSVTGFFASLFSSKIVRSKTVMRIEEVGSSGDNVGSEPYPAGGDWSWCNATSSAP